LLALTTACTTSESLNSDRIETAFGNYGVEILSEDSARRVSSLYSGPSDDRITRTYAIVEYIGQPRPEYRAVHEAIVAGASIGQAFRRAGWVISKQHLYIDELEVPATYGGIATLMRIELPAILALHQYLFLISRDERTFDYARITELHHPAYLSVADLRTIYGEILFDDSNRDSIHDFIGPPGGN
jgi:hypothetical protein